MKELAVNIAKKYYSIEPTSISSLGAGFYGCVFLVELKKPPYKIVVKVYFKNELAQKEKRQIEVLSKYTLIPMPKIYYIHKHDRSIPNDVLVMEYIDGVNAGIQTKINEKYVDKIGDQIIDNLLAYHSVVNKEGFGELNADTFVKDWRDYYKIQVTKIHQKAYVMYEDGRISEKTYDIIDEVYRKYDKIFYLPITEACLIHGDYNMWNIMLNKNLTDVIAVIDPYNCQWADAEFDLYQLNNANGKDFSLLERYAERKQLSENFDIKNSVYELFTEVNHFYDANVDPIHSNIPAQALSLKEKI
jgi:fructosamine-3-kinase